MNVTERIIVIVLCVCAAYLLFHILETSAHVIKASGLDKIVDDKKIMVCIDKVTEERHYNAYNLTVRGHHNDLKLNEKICVKGKGYRVTNITLIDGDDFVGPQTRLRLEQPLCCGLEAGDVIYHSCNLPLSKSFCSDSEGGVKRCLTTTETGSVDFFVVSHEDFLCLKKSGSKKVHVFGDFMSEHEIISSDGYSTINVSPPFTNPLQSGTEVWIGSMDSR